MYDAVKYWTVNAANTVHLSRIDGAPLITMAESLSKPPDSLTTL